MDQKIIHPRGCGGVCFVEGGFLLTLFSMPVQTYLDCRNAILDRYRENPRRRLSFPEVCRKSMPWHHAAAPVAGWHSSAGTSWERHVHQTCRL